MKSLLFGITVGLSLAVNLSAQTTTDETLNKIKQLEVQVQAILLELNKLKKAAVRVQPTKEETLSSAAVTEKKAETEKKPVGIEIANGVRLTPYGIFYFNAFGNSGGTNNADVPIFATPTGSGNVSASVRQTRLGLKLEGAKIRNAKLSSVVEGDFFGGFPSTSIGENFGVFRLRLAFARLDWEKAAVTVGQDWMVFAPVNPISMAAAGNPQMAASGNNWARLPQVRIDYKLGDHVIWQGAILASQTGDFATNAAFIVQPTSGAAARMPFLQTRVAFTDKNWFGTKKVGTVGISGHYGRSRVSVGATRYGLDSYGIALDWNFPISTRITLLGEAFIGENLGGFQAGIFQSYNNDFARRVGSTFVADGTRSIGTQGGWLQIGFTPPVIKDRISLHASVGLDDPNNADLVSVSHRDWRSRNVVFAGDIVYRFTPQFSIGAEFRRFQTNYYYNGRQNANHINLGASYAF